MNRQGKERKRLKKLAAAVPAEEIKEFLAVDKGSPVGHFLIGTSDDNYTICCWHPSNGLMELTIDDDAMYEACIQFLVKNGLTFQNRNEFFAHAKEHKWPNPRRL